MKADRINTRQPLFCPLFSYFYSLLWQSSNWASPYVPTTSVFSGLVFSSPVNWYRLKMSRWTCGVFFRKWAVGVDGKSLIYKSTKRRERKRKSPARGVKGSDGEPLDRSWREKTSGTIFVRPRVECFNPVLLKTCMDVRLLAAVELKNDERERS